jgi:hypothetical protein
MPHIRGIHDSILDALAETTEKEREEALTKARKSWADNGSSGVQPPHLLAHILRKKYDIVPLLKAMGLTKRDARDIQILKKVCAKLNFSILFAPVEKALACEIYVDPDDVRRWQQSRPKIEPSEHEGIILDELTLECVVDLGGFVVGNRIPIRDIEVVQEDPFLYESAKIETHVGEEEDSDRYGEMACLLAHQ